MKNRTLTFLLLLFLVPVLVSAQQRSLNVHKSAFPKIDDPKVVLEKSITPGYSPADGSYIPVDTLGNSLSAAEFGVTPLFFDPYSGVLALVHRGWAGHYAAGSGQMWYNISTDFGITWSRVPGGINTLLSQITGRYPNMTISNPTKGPLSSTLAAFAWPELNTDVPANFGWMGYAADQPVGNGSPAAFLEERGTFYSTQMVMWANDTSPEIFWTSQNTLATSADVLLHKTTDYSTIDTLTPPQWNTASFSGFGQYIFGGRAFQGIQYLTVASAFQADTTVDSPPNGLNVGYSKSTDLGQTWSKFKFPDWKKIPRLANYQILFDWKKNDTVNTVSYQGDMGVDKNGHVHIVTIIGDTLNLNTGTLVDIFETDTDWDATIITKGIDTAYANGTYYTSGPGQVQMGPCATLAFDSTHTVMAVQWINTPAHGKLNDVFVSYKNLNDTSWASPVNLTNSDSANNTEAHMAPYLKSNGSNSYTLFSMYGYNPGTPVPAYDGNTVCVFYAEPYTFTVLPTGINDHVATVNSFSLMQNYPNPFNPSTLIKYTLAEKNNVSIKIFDVLGREVANLVNESQAAGSHQVSFNASKLASGMYIYTLRAGNNSVSKKMMLLK
jgi:hypothetical protein